VRFNSGVLAMASALDTVWHERTRREVVDELSAF
jgi:hypothetical protein